MSVFVVSGGSMISVFIVISIVASVALFMPRFLSSVSFLVCIVIIGLLLVSLFLLSSFSASSVEGSAFGVVAEAVAVGVLADLGVVKSALFIETSIGGESSPNISSADVSMSVVASSSLGKSFEAKFASTSQEVLAGFLSLVGFIVGFIAFLVISFSICLICFFVFLIFFGCFLFFV